MAASKLDFSGVFQPAFVVQAGDKQFKLPPSAFRIQRNGIEFHSPGPLSLWTEMTVSLRPPGQAGSVKCTGVVVACDGSRHVGYQISMLFLNLSRQSRERLSQLSQSQFA
jgi:hypothetical protein